MIKFRNVTKEIDKEIILKNINLTIHKGSIYGLLGSNGAGKTTILKLLAGIYKQNRGDIVVDSHHVFENLEVKKRMFFIPDYPSFLPQYTLNQMALFYKERYKSWNDEIYQTISNLLELKRNKKIHSFSKGVQRQVAFCLAFATMPEILILDEPFDGLDPIMRTKMKNIIIQEVAGREMTVVISSHNLDEIEDLCDHVSIIHKGECMVENDLDELKADYHKIQVAYKENKIEEIIASFPLVHFEKRGSISLLIIKGNIDLLLSELEKKNPLILDILPLSLEEIFTYQMGEMNYAIQNITIS